MNLPGIAIKYHLFTIMAFVILLLMGLFSFFGMPRIEDPVLHLPTVGVTIVYPGASPYDIEKHVVDLIEPAVNELSRVKEINTTIKESVAFMTVDFEYGVDPKEKEKDVQAQINVLRNQLPVGVVDIRVEKFSTTSVRVLQVALISEEASYGELAKTGELIEKKLEKIDGVRKVDIEAYPEQEVRIALNPIQMTQKNISIVDIERAVKSNNANIPGGVVKVSDRLFNIKTSGVYNDLEQLRNTIVGSYDGKLIFLKNVAKVFMAYEDEKWMARLNGQRCIFITLQQKEGFNIFSVIKPVRAVLEKFQLPPHMELKIAFDQSREVEKRISGFGNSLLQGMALVGLIIFMLLGFRSATLVMISIPFSILIGLWMVDMAGFNLQQTTITALVVALGLLVDNSIAVIENIERFLREGNSPKEAAIKGTQQLIAPVASATLTTILAFIPILSIQNVTGAFIRSLPVTVIVTLLASFIIATTLTPFLASRIMKKPPMDGRGNSTWAFRQLQKFVNGPLDMLLKFTFNNQILTVGFTSIILIGSLALIPSVGVSFFPKAEKPLFRIQVELPEGSNLDATNRAIQFVESILDQQPEVEYYLTNVGKGNPRLYYNMNSKDYSNRFGEILVFNKSYEPQAFNNFLEKIRILCDDYIGAQVNIIEFTQGPSVNPPILIEVHGKDLDQLQYYANKVARIAADVPGIINIRNPVSKNKTELYFNINREKSLLMGVPLHVTDQTIRSFVNGSPLGEFQNEEGESFDMVMRYDFKDQFRLEDFEHITVKSMYGSFVPLKQIANMEFKQTPSSIEHTDQERIVKIYADIRSGFLVSNAIEELRPQLDEIEWMAGCSYKFGGEIEEQSESFGGMSSASLLALFLILSVLIVHFQSFSQLFIIFSALPLALIGAILALFFTGYPFSFTAIVGLTSLIGIAINNSLVLVDYANHLRQSGMTKRDAALHAAKVRFIPILMTTLTTILGLLPLTLAGGSMWAPMGWVIIGGLISSTVFVLLIVPVLYQWLTLKMA